VRQFTRGKNYFASRFGVNVTSAWAADSFGHSAGLPEILVSAGITSFAYTRPGSPVSSPAFWWEGPGGSRILAYCPPAGWYGTERDELPRKLDDLLRVASEGSLENIGVFYGVGNHGGGPTRRQLKDIATWAAAHPEVEVKHSGLHGLFRALFEELAHREAGFLPVHRGELNFCLRGCYSSVAKFKYLYRRTEAAVSRAEKSAAVLGALVPASSDAMPSSQVRSLKGAWDAVLFNSFHDILPGSSIERAMEDQISWLGAGVHAAQGAEFDALNRLASLVDTSVEAADGDNPGGISFLVWNPHPFAYSGAVELEGALDARPIWKYENRPDEMPVQLLGPDKKPVPFQRIHTEHHSMPHLPWRVRAVTHASLAPFGWAVYELAYRENPAIATNEPSSPAVTVTSAGGLDNGIFRVETTSNGVKLYRNGLPFIGDLGLTAVTVEDPWGSWGAMDEAKESLNLSEVCHHWTVDATQVIENGPEYSSIWVRMTGGNSTLDLTIGLSRGRDAVDFDARILWNDRSARLKLVLPVGDSSTAVFDVPGASIRREPSGEVPGGRWVSIGDVGFASNGIYNFDHSEGVLRATVVRASRYGADETFGPEVNPWTPTVDRGELRLRFLIAPSGEELVRKATLLEQPPVVLTVPAKAGNWGRSGSLGELTPDSLDLLAIKPAETGEGVVIRVQNRTGSLQSAVLNWDGQQITLGLLEDGRISSWLITRDTADGWVAEPTNSLA
jgi:alpha-mannosidase